MTVREQVNGPADAVNPQAEFEHRDRIWDAIDSIGTAMLVTRDSTDLRCRPMATLPRRSSGVIWMIANRNDHKDDEIRKMPDVCLAFSKPGSNTYCSVSGKAEIVDDRSILEALWTSAADAWFDGPQDPDAILIRVEPTQAELWDMVGGDVVSTARYWIAKLRDEDPDTGVNVKVNLS